ncbi:hypothetical protein GBA52_028389 [Prunus armeniaca]|nr:hypothetical protein GBA52_028389 [Prunus armeniaca]
MARLIIIHNQLKPVRSNEHTTEKHTRSKDLVRGVYLVKTHREENKLGSPSAAAYLEGSAGLWAMYPLLISRPPRKWHSPIL